ERHIIIDPHKNAFAADIQVSNGKFRHKIFKNPNRKFNCEIPGVKKKAGSFRSSVPCAGGLAREPDPANPHYRPIETAKLIPHLLFSANPRQHFQMHPSSTTF